MQNIILNQLGHVKTTTNMLTLSKTLFCVSIAMAQHVIHLKWIGVEILVYIYTQAVLYM